MRNRKKLRQAEFAHRGFSDRTVMLIGFLPQYRKSEFDENPVSILFVGDGFPVPRNSQTHMGQDGKPVPYEENRYGVPVKFQFAVSPHYPNQAFRFRGQPIRVNRITVLPPMESDRPEATESASTVMPWSTRGVS